MPAPSPSDIVDYTKGLDPSKFAFSAARKLDKVSGATVNMTYDGKALFLLAPPLVTPFGVGIYKGKDGEAKKDNESKKPTMTLNLPDDEATKAFRAAIGVIDAAVLAHLKKDAAGIFGENGFGLKGKALAEKLTTVAAGGLTKYLLLRLPKEDSYSKFLRLGIPPSGCDYMDKQGKDITMEDVAPQSTVSAVMKVRGFFINALMMSVQVDAVQVITRNAARVNKTAIFAAAGLIDTVDEEEETDDAPPDSPPQKKRAKREAVEPAAVAEELSLEEY